MQKTLFFTCIILCLLACSPNKVPWALRKTIADIDENLNDTVKYDFRISPEDIATTKHHFGLGRNIRNERKLWKGGLLKSYFKIKGIFHPDDMSDILLTSYHRKLNGKPINFKEQKKNFKVYWKNIDNPVDSLNPWWVNYHKINRDSLNEIYYANYSNGKNVLTYVNAWKWRKGGGSGSSVKIIGKIISRKEHYLQTLILDHAEPEPGYDFNFSIGDTIELDPDGIYLIPPTDTISQ